MSDLNISISDNFSVEKESVKSVNSGGIISLLADTDVKENNDVCRTPTVLCPDEKISIRCNLHDLNDCQKCADKLLNFNKHNIISHGGEIKYNKNISEIKSSNQTIKVRIRCGKNISVRIINSVKSRNNNPMKLPIIKTFKFRYKKKTKLPPSKNCRFLMVTKSQRSRKIIISVKQPNKAILNKKDIFINKLLGFSENNITVDANKPANLLLPSKLNVKGHKNSIKRYKKLIKIVKNIKSKKVKNITIKILRDLKYLRKIANKLKKASNGNINKIKKVIKIIGWNKGNLELISKIDDIKILINEKKPDVFVINELNLYKNYDPKMFDIDGYNFEYDNLFKTRGVSRTGIYIANNLNYNRIKKVENIGESIVAIKIGYPNQRKLNIVGYYRQWSKIFSNKSYEPYSIKQQEINLENQMNKLKELSNTETIILGDFNIDFKILNKTEDQKNNYEKNFKKRINIIKDQLLGNNFFQLIKSDTRNQKILDHIYYNNLSKLQRVYVDIDSDSDHNFIIIEKKMKVNLCEERYHITRRFYSIDFDKLNNDIMCDLDYINMLQDDNIERITENLTRVIRCHLDKQAPLIKIKSNESNVAELSNETKDLINKKNLSYKQMKIVPNEENKKKFQNII